ncbi:MAG: SLC13 family permease, partial [Pirellulaceae bacterium]|nr:SLC13 family permease [Pirellulaceae bacterium]
MIWEGWVTIAVVVLFIVGLARGWAAPDLLSLACLAVLVTIGSLTGSRHLPGPGEALAGMGNSGLITVGALFVVVAGLTQTGAMALVVQPLLGRPRTALSAQLRLLLPVTTLSAFLNNTPVVAMFMPVVNEICKKTNISPSKLFLPMAYAATFGGVCTLIGTSTNLIVGGLVGKAKLPDLPAIQMFDVTWVGLPCAVAGVVYLLLFSRRLLADRRPAISLTDDPRQYTVEMLVQPGGPLVGQSVEKAGLRHLPGLYLAEIDRQGVILPAVGPEERLQAGDRLVFVGIIESVVDLQKMRGLIPATDQTFKLDAPRTQRSLIEAVVSDRCPLVGKSIREGRFRSEYNAAVIAVARSGKR